MKLLTIDFETYYDQQYSLSKITTEDYVKDPRFEVILVGVKVNDQPSVWCSGTRMEIGTWLQQFDIPNSGVIAHNAMFDVLILQEIFGIMPAFIFDTMNMAQAHLKPFSPSVSLKACLEYCDLGVQKGTYVLNMLGRSRASLSKQELHDYAGYCMDDCDGEYKLFQHLLPLFPKDELHIIDMTHRMYFNPVLELDANLLAELLQEERAHKAQLLATLGSRVDKSDLLSNDKFAELLQEYGVDPPMKVSPTTGKMTWAFAKNDPEFRAMQEEYEDDDLVSAVIEARLSIKSTITETRTARLLDIAKKYRWLRVPLGYYKAHTGRYGGTQKINLQNPPRVDKSRMRFAIRAPKGYVILGADLSQIEARIVAWLAGQRDLVESFRRGDDIYSTFATRATGVSTVKKRSKQDDIRRFIGKTCILGLGFGMGAKKLMATLNKEKGIKVTLDQSQRFVNTYRNDFNLIPRMWEKLDRALNNIATGSAKLQIGPVQAGHNVVVLPSGMVLYYNELSRVDGEWVYLYGRETRKMFGGKLCENIVQALARTIVMEQMLTIKRKLGLSPVMQIHDELDYCVPVDQAAAYAGQIAKIMSVPPTWAPDLPVAVEIAYGQTLGDCK